MTITETWVMEWRDNVKRLVDEIRERYESHSHEPDAWPKNWEECDKYRGCLFRPVHYSMDVKNSRLRLLSQNYVEERWDPAEL